MGWLSSAAVTSSSVLLGIVFTNWAVDHYVLWSPAPVEPNHFKAALQYYHDVWLYPPYVAVVVGAIYALGAGACLISFAIGSMVDLLFDGACCFLWLATALVWVRDIDPGLRSLNTDANAGAAHLVDLKKVASGHLSICVCLTGVLMLQTCKHFVVRSAAHDKPQSGPSVSAVPPQDVAAPAPAPTIQEKPLHSGSSPLKAAAAPVSTKPAGGASSRQTKQAKQGAALAVQPRSDSDIAPTTTTQRVTRSKSAALKRSDSETSDAASSSSALKSPSSKKRKTRSQKA